MNDDEASIVSPDLNVNTGDIHCTDLDLSDKNGTGLNTGDKHGKGLSLNTGDKHGTDSSQNTGDEHGTGLSQNAGDKNGTGLSQNAGDKNGTGLSQNTGDKHGTRLSQNAGDKHGTRLSQNAGDKHGTDANKIDVVNPTTMPEVPDMNTSNKTLKGGEVTQDKDQYTPTDKTDGDDKDKRRNQDFAALLEKHSQANEQLNIQIQQIREHSKNLQDQLETERQNHITKQKKELGPVKEQLQVHIQTTGILVAEKTELQSQLNQSQKVAETRFNEIEELSGRLKASRQRVSDLERSLSTTSTSSQQFEKKSEVKSTIRNKKTRNRPGEEVTPQLDMKILKALTKVSNSIGMFDGEVQGSCWRAGTDLIVTAWHVVCGHIWDDDHEFLNEMKLPSVKIKFDYTSSGDYDESNIFEVEPKVIYYSEILDTVILRLKPNGKVGFPPPFRRLNHCPVQEDENLKIHLIGHPHGSPQRVNHGIRLWNPTEEKMQSLKTFCKDEGYEYGYAELDKAERLVMKCEFEHGASGCPGVVVLDDNQLYLVTMFLRGFPDFYFSEHFTADKKEKFPKSNLFQHGVNIGAIYKDLKKCPMYADIFKDIFIKQNPPVNRSIRNNTI